MVTLYVPYNICSIVSEQKVLQSVFLVLEILIMNGGKMEESDKRKADPSDNGQSGNVAPPEVETSTIPDGGWGWVIVAVCFMLRFIGG